MFSSILSILLCKKNILKIRQKKRSIPTNNIKTFASEKFLNGSLASLEGCGKKYSSPQTWEKNSVEIYFCEVFHSEQIRVPWGKFSQHMLIYG